MNITIDNKEDEHGQIVALVVERRGDDHKPLDPPVKIEIEIKWLPHMIDVMRGWAYARNRPDLEPNDIVLWTREQENHLRSQQWDKLDVANLLLTLSHQRDKAQHEHMMATIKCVRYMVRLAYTQDRNYNKERAKLYVARERLQGALKGNPCLMKYTHLEIAGAWDWEIKKQHAIDAPKECPWRVEQVLDHGFWPDEWKFDVEELAEKSDRAALATYKQMQAEELAMLPWDEVKRQLRIFAADAANARNDLVSGEENPI